MLQSDKVHFPSALITLSNTKIHLPSEKFAQALRALNIARRSNPEHSEIHLRIVDYHRRGMAM